MLQVHATVIVRPWAQAYRLSRRILCLGNRECRSRRLSQTILLPTSTPSYILQEEVPFFKETTAFVNSLETSNWVSDPVVSVSRPSGLSLTPISYPGESLLFQDPSIEQHPYLSRPSTLEKHQRTAQCMTLLIIKNSI